MTDIWDEKPNIIPEGYYYSVSEMDAWLKGVKWELICYEALKDIEMDIIAKLRFWNREDEGPSLFAQGMLSVATIDTLIERYIDQFKKLEAVQKWCDYHAVPITAGATRASLKRLFKIMENSEFKENDE